VKFVNYLIALTFATYWKDPFNYDKYLASSLFLADINNERATKNATYRANIMSLNYFLMTWSGIDKIVTPPSSGMFEQYEKNDGYIGDFIGLRTLVEVYT
jgi:palmitoyl-protein thioesterase